MTITIDDILETQTAADVKASILAKMTELGLPTTGWKPGAVVRTIISSFSEVLGTGWGVVGDLARSAFRRTSSGRWLTLVASEVFGTDRLAATFAGGEMTFNNAGGGVYDLGVGELVVSCSRNKKEYRSTEVIHIGASETGVKCDFQAVEAGSASSVSAGEITTMVTSLSGVTCTNAAAWVAFDEESDDDLLVRSDGELDAKSPNGPPAAYSAIAKKVKHADGTPIGVTRTKVTEVDGEVTLTCGLAAGPVSSDDIALIDTAIQQSCVPTGITATVQSGTSSIQTITHTLYLYDTETRTDAQLTAAIDTALRAWFATRPIGGDATTPGGQGYLYRDRIRSIIESVSESTIRCDLTVPSGDVSVGAFEIPMLGTVTPAFVRVAT